MTTTAISWQAFTCSKLTINTPNNVKEEHQANLIGVPLVINFEHNS